MRQEVIRRSSRPGQRLRSENGVAQQLEGSRGAVREAMKTLQARGVVTIQQGDDIHVADKALLESEPVLVGGYLT